MLLNKICLWLDRVLGCVRLGEKLVKDFYNDFRWKPTGIQSLVLGHKHTNRRHSGCFLLKNVHFYFVKIIISFCCENKIRHTKFARKIYNGWMWNLIAHKVNIGLSKVNEIEVTVIALECHIFKYIAFTSYETWKSNYF